MIEVTSVQLEIGAAPGSGLRRSAGAAVIEASCLFITRDRGGCERPGAVTENVGVDQDAEGGARASFFAESEALTPRVRRVQGAANAEDSVAEYMREDHDRGDVAVSEEFVDGANVMASLEQVGGEGVAEGVAGHTPWPSCTR